MPDAAASGPQRIGPYQIERSLGRGGMGEVWLGWDERLERRVALKRLRADAVPTPHLQERLLREARASASLSHPSIVRIFDVLEIDGETCLVLEFVEGETVAARLVAGPLPLGQALDFGHDVASGLAAAHRAGLVHRDLKAENVIVAAGGQAKILDFGLVRPPASARDEGLTETGALLGTLRSMAPEQAAGGPVDHRADLFALGVLLYEMVSGVSPFRGATAVETLRRLAAADPLPLDRLRPGLPPELVELIGRLLAREAEDRPSDSAEVAAQLGRLAGAESRSGADGSKDSESVSDLPTRSVELPAFSRQDSSRSARAARSNQSPAPVSPTPARRRLHGRALWIAAGALGLGSFAGTAYFAFHASSPPRRVVVVPPSLPAQTSPGRLDELAASAHTVVLDALASSPELAVFDAAAPELAAMREGPEDGAASPTAARQVAGEERLRLSLSPRGSEVRIDLRRVDARDDRVLWAGSVTVPAAEGEDGLLRDSLAAELRKAYGSKFSGGGGAALEARPADYSAYLAVRRDLARGEIDREPLLRRLEEILRTSPAFLEAEIGAAEVALSLFESSRDEAFAGAAERHLAAARRLAPADPRPLYAEARLALGRGRPAEAAAVAARLHEISPADPELDLLRAAVAEQEGRPEAALRALRQAVRRAPSWRALYLLADLEAHQGQVAAARGHLRTILASASANRWALSRLATLELTYGDLVRAESIYLQLVSRGAQRHDLTNLGLARFLLGRYPEAIEAYRRALAIDPGHAVSLLNLADAEAAAGLDQEARGHYAETLARVGEPSGAPLTVQASVLRAQALAALGRTDEAAAEAQALLRRSGDDPFVQYSAALVYALIGDRASARINAKAARRGGIQPRWFSIPGFRSLRGDPELTELWAP